ncbi:MAG: D-alanyl-D-alanine carboxypeptidase family protein [Acidobacteriota bacterium]
MPLALRVKNVIMVLAILMAFCLSAESAERKGKAASSSRPCNCKKGATAKKNSKAVRSRKKSVSVPCHPRGYVDPRIQKNLNAAFRDMRRAGIRPVVTSTWRSSAKQASLHRCSNSARCRIQHPGLYRAKAPGTSLHEAGFAVDIAGVAVGRRGAKRLTPRGRKIVRIMRKNGFAWRYGLADPVHFEADPRRHGYRSARQAIKVNQTRCKVKFVSSSKVRSKSTARKKKGRG